MNPHIQQFKQSAHLSGETWGFPTGKQLREFGLKDFLENGIDDKDDAPTIAVKALQFFCEQFDPSWDIVKFGTLTVGFFLNTFHARREKRIPEVALKDLVSLLEQRPTELQIRGWIRAHFG